MFSVIKVKYKMSHLIKGFPDNDIKGVISGNILSFCIDTFPYIVL